MSQTNAVEYILKLKSGEFDSGLDRADQKASRLDSRMGSLARSAAGFVSALAIGNYLNNAVNAFNESEQSLAQLQATMKATGGAVGVTTDAMVAQAKALQGLTTYDDDAIIGMQSVLATFKDIKGEIFTGAVPAILDLSQKMGQDLKSSAVQVGKALNDPIRGVAALRKVGVSFTEDQEKLIKSLVGTNRMAEAQTMILKELQSEFGGSAEAAALVGTGPMKQLQNQMGDVNEEVGKLTLELSKGLVPILKNTVIPALSSAAEWANKNSSAIGGLAKGVTAFLIVARGAPMVLSAFGASAATLIAAAGPITLLAAALGTLAYGYDLVTNSAERAKKAMQTERAERNDAVKDRAQQALPLLIRQGMAAGMTKEKALASISANSDNAANITIEKEKKKQQEALRLAEVYKRSPEIYSKYMLQADEAEKRMQDAETQRGLFKRIKSNAPGASNGAMGGDAPPRTPGASNGAMGGDAPPRTPRGSTKSQATGSKAVTINVSIGDLVKTLNVNTTNLVDGAQKIKEQVTAVLMSAVNDFQIVADR